MKKFLINSILFLLMTMVVGEVIVRLTHQTADIPQRTINKNGIQQYFPNQEGYWKGGNHKWMINKLGWPGELPKTNDNLIMIIGDSFIENFMNPNECHQSAFLKENMADYNFMEAGRSGISLIEALEISKQTDSLNPIHSLIYVNNGDLYESITQIKPMNDITQLNIDNNEIVYGKMKAPGIKKILYSWKLMYYLYNRFPLSEIIKSNSNAKNIDSISTIDKPDYSKEITKLAEFINNKYNIHNKTLVFHPNSEESLINICKDVGFNVIILDSNNDESWTFDYDHHWTCYGHKRAAQQVSKHLLKNFSSTSFN